MQISDLVFDTNHMNLASRTPRVTDTNPCSVLRSISAPQGHDLNRSSFRPSEEPRILSGPEAPDAHATESPDLSQADWNSLEETGAGVIPLRINPDTSPDREPGPVDPLAGVAESASQIQQLSARLESSAIELARKESEFGKRVERWNQTAAQHQSELEARKQELEQQASQVRCQQLHLMQLQTDILKSHEATRVAIETLVDGQGDDATAVAAMKALAYELGGRFDYITRRWEHLTQLMESTNAKITASQSIDDRVDWVGEFER